MSIQIFSVSKLQNFAGFALYQSNMDDLVGWALVNQPTWKLQANNLTSDKKKTALLVSVCVSSHCLREEITGSPSWYWYKVIVANEYANHFKYSDWICTEKLVKVCQKERNHTNVCSSLHAVHLFYSPLLSSAYVQWEADFAAAFHLSVVEFVQIGSGNV